jgi:uncharacterized membrane protein YcaP (DUF421 family)
MDELMSHLRANAARSLADVERACMEPDGMISVIKKTGKGPAMSRRN